MTRPATSLSIQYGSTSLPNQHVNSHAARCSVINGNSLIFFFEELWSGNVNCLNLHQLLRETVGCQHQPSWSKWHLALTTSRAEQCQTSLWSCSTEAEWPSPPNNNKNTRNSEQTSIFHTLWLFFWTAKHHVHCFSWYCGCITNAFLFYFFVNTSLQRFHWLL